MLPTLPRFLPTISTRCDGIPTRPRRLSSWPKPSASTQRLRLTNGGSEAISLVDREVGGQVWAEPEFGLHPRNPDGPVWRSDPHNPSGHLASPDETADVWDEAFYPLATGQWTAGRAGVVVGSLTKVFAAPGLRLGYIIADDVERFARHQPQWSVSSLAVAALPELLELVGSARLVGGHRHRPQGAGRDVSTGAASRWRPPMRPGCWYMRLVCGIYLAPHGVVVRDCSSFGMPEHVRVAVPDSDGLARLESAMLLSGVEAKSG